MSDDLALRNSVRTMVAAFEAAEREVRATFAALVETERRVNAAFGVDGIGRIRIDASGAFRDSFDRADDTIEKMTRAAWSVIVDRLELKRFMSIKRWEELQRSLERDKLPAITVESVTSFAHGHMAQAREMLTEAVREVFEWLRPRGDSKQGKLKTNTEMEVGERTIVGYTVETTWMGGGFRVNNYRRQHLIALENVFNGLAGNGTICKSYQSLLETAIETAKDGTGETELFEFRACRNQNLHLRFKRLDLLERFNAIAGGKTLRPAESEEDRLRREIAQAKAENERLRRDASKKT